VVVTFDDGYRDNLTRALPLLRCLGVRATFFVVSGAVGDANRWTPEPPLGGRPLLGWDGVRDLLAARMEIGSHTVTHADLTEVEPEVAVRELTESRSRLEQELGVAVRHFAFPYGKRSPALREAAVRAGYRTALGITPGLNSLAVSRYGVRRLEVWGDGRFLRFAIELWLGAPLRRR
jgi:peptidoglycan/xylan/chitin deacetylase (PgdA/CDA1 family)